MDRTELPDFSGKIVVLQHPGNWRPFVLESPTFRCQGGRWFVVGKCYRGANEGFWANEAMVGIPWRRLAYYMIFKTPEAFHEAVNHSESEKPTRGWFGKAKPA